MGKQKIKLIAILLSIITICIIMAGCGQGDDAYRGEQSQLAVERVFDKIKTAYGEDYLPDTEIDTEHLKEEFNRLPSGPPSRRQGQGGQRQRGGKAIERSA